MTVISDTFPASSLNSDYWASSSSGSGSIVVGSPSDGVYPQGIDDDGDQVLITSEDGLTVPANSNFSAEIMFDDVFSDGDQAIVSFLAWRSYQGSGSGNSLYGVDLRLRVAPSGSSYKYQRAALVSGSSSVIDKLSVSSFTSGGFKIERAAKVYSLYYLDFSSNWVLLESYNLGFDGPGYIVFGQLAEDPSVSVVPWIVYSS
jgi:hypothetical protein